MRSICFLMLCLVLGSCASQAQRKQWERQENAWLEKQDTYRAIASESEEDE